METIKTSKHIANFEEGARFYFWPYSLKGIAQYCDRITTAIEAAIPEAALEPGREMTVNFRKVGPPGRWYDGYNYDVCMQFKGNSHQTILHEETHCAIARANLPQDHDEAFPKIYWPKIQKKYRELYGWWRFMLDCGGLVWLGSANLRGE